jgi:cysteine-rich repeat protein
VNPVTGAFSVTGELTGQCTGLVISGRGDGEAFTGTYSATTGFCTPGGSVSGTKCSNGVIDPGENCEDGNLFDGDCCSARCVLDPAGTACIGDGNVCTDDVCNATGACTHVPNTSPCDDNNPCTVGDVCAGGTCAGSSGPAGQPCADDSNPCTDDLCNATGGCTHVPNTNPCDDGNPCTNGDVCTAGACTGSPAPVGQRCPSHSNACIDDVCDGTGTCGVPNTNPCDDGNACSIGDVCTGGMCIPSGVAPACAGTIDLTGTWSLSGPCVDHTAFVPSNQRDFAQTGAVLASALPGGNPAIGAVNPATGMLTANTPVDIPTSLGAVPCLESIIGTAAPSGNVFTGTGVVTCSGSTALHPAAVTGLKCPRGQPCCGNGIVETGEVCDDQFCCDATCQARAVAGTPCADDSNACTDDVCNGTGTCTHAIIGAAGCSLPDPYLCYKVGLATGQPQFTPVQKSLQDQFGTLVFDVKRIEGLCNPAQKNTEPPPARPEVHQADYQVAPARGQPAFVKSTHTVIDEFGQHQLRVVKPAALLEPSAKVLGAGGAPVVDDGRRPVRVLSHGSGEICPDRRRADRGPVRDRALRFDKDHRALHANEQGRRGPDGAGAWGTWSATRRDAREGLLPQVPAASGVDQQHELRPGGPGRARGERAVRTGLQGRRVPTNHHHDASAAVRGF